MMVVTAKVKKKNLIIVAAVLIAILIVLLWPANKQHNKDVQAFAGATNEERILFLNELGWKVSEAPIDTQQVIIPTEAGEVYTKYNDLQKAQGYDLDRYAGKIANRYVYEIKNHPESDGPYFVSLLVCKNRIIGGDVVSSVADGKMYPMQFPQDNSNT